MRGQRPAGVSGPKRVDKTAAGLKQHFRPASAALGRRISSKIVNCARTTARRSSFVTVGYAATVMLQTTTFERKRGQRDLWKRPVCEGRAAPEKIRKGRRGPGLDPHTPHRKRERALPVLVLRTTTSAAAEALLARMESCRPDTLAMSLGCSSRNLRLPKLPLPSTLFLHSVVHRLVHFLLYTAALGVGCDDLWERVDCHRCEQSARDNCVAEWDGDGELRERRGWWNTPREWVQQLCLYNTVLQSV